MRIDNSKYYWSILKADITSYIKKYNMYLASKLIRHKAQNNLQFFFVLTHQWKDLFIDFVTKPPVLTNWKGKIYGLMLVIINKLIRMIYYKLVKITINNPGIIEVIFLVVLQYDGFLDSIVSNCGSVFSLKLWLLLYYFLKSGKSFQRSLIL